MTFHSDLGASLLNIDPARQPVLNHRSGWAFALQALASLHDPRGILFDSFIERTFSWMERGERKQGRIPYREPWIGVFHNPPGIPRWHDYQSSPQAILARDSFRESLPHCLGLIALSEYLADWLAQSVAVPVSSLVHPTEIPQVQFSPEAFFANPQPAVIQIGWWLRRLHSIYQLQAGGYQKVMLAVDHRYFKHMLRRDRDRTPLTDEQLTSVAVLPFVSNEEYDRLLSQNIAFCDLIDSSANNVVVECIARNTPLLINRLPAIEEYLGPDYPLYFSSLDEAAVKLARVESVLEAYAYLRELPKERFSQQAFREAFLQSDVYRNVSAGPSRSSGRTRQYESAGERPIEHNQELNLVLSRAASGAVYVERAEFQSVGTGLDPTSARILQRMVCGWPLPVVRRLTLNDLLQHVGPARADEAHRLHDALQRALGRL